MSEDPSNAPGGEAPANGGQAGGQVALLSDPVDVIIDKLLRYVASDFSCRIMVRCRWLAYAASLPSGLGHRLDRVGGRTVSTVLDFTHLRHLQAGNSDFTNKPNIPCKDGKESCLHHGVLTC